MLWTFKDQIQALRSFLENVAGNAELARIKRAIYDAHRDLAGAHRWSYYTGTYQISTVAAYSTGTIAYDHSGGSAERIVTLTTGTWPSWAALGTILIDSVPYKVVSRISDSVIQLSIHTNPGADVASGTDYTLYQDSYRLPETFVSLESVIALSLSAALYEIPPEEYGRCERRSITPGSIEAFTIMGDPNYQGRNGLRISPPPLTADTLEVLYHRMPKLPTIEEYSTGTVAVSANSATLTGTGTAWTDSMIGCSLRISSNSSVPTGPDRDNPYAVERVISDVASATSLTLDAVVPDAYSGKGHAISDIIDLDQVTMLNAFQRGCEAQLMLNAANRGALRAAYDMEVMRAKEMDNKSLAPRVAGAQRSTRFRYPAVEIEY